MLLQKLHCRFGLENVENRTQFVKIDDNVSETLPLDCGVPQGSVLCLLLYLLYTALVGDILCKYGLSFLLYADNTKVYTYVLLRDQ